MVAMLCCLPAADRVVWLRLHRYGLSFCNVACSGVVSLKRGIYCGGLCELSVCARSSQDRRSALGAARHSLHVAVDYFLLGSNLDATGAISSLDVLLWRACCRVAALFF